MKTEKQRVENFAEKFHDKDVRIRYVLGAFGDMAECVGIVEEEVFPEEGGSFIKYLGCSYLQKGCPLGVIPMELIECYGLAKKILLRTAVDIVKEKLIAFFIVLYWLFKRKKFYELLNRYVNDVHSKTIGVLIFDEKRYNKFPKELRRAVKLAFKKETGVDIDKAELDLKDKKLRLYIPLYKLTELAIFLIDFDTAYKLPFQDALSEAKDIEELVDILIERNQEKIGVGARLLGIKKTIKLIKCFPPAGRMLKTFFEELNLEEIKMDEADWYWCLRRKWYNFKGILLEERLEEVKKIDKEKEHVKVKFNIAFSEEDFRRKMGEEPPLDNSKKNN